MTKTRTIAIHLVTILALTLSPSLFGRDVPARHAFAQIYSYLEVELTGDDLDRLVDGWNASVSPSRSLDERQASFTELLQLMIELQDAGAAYPRGAPSSWVGRVDEIRGMSAPPPLIDTPTSSSINGGVATYGDGPVELVLVAGSIPSSVLIDEFIELNGERFHVTAIDLPGIGETRPLPLPPHRRYEERDWIRRVERHVIDEIDARGIDQPVLVGHDIGAWIALSLASEHPDRFRAAVLTEPALPLMLFSPTPSGLRLADAETRTLRVNRQLPPLLPPGTAESRYQASSRTQSTFAQEAETAERLAKLRAEIHPTVAARYRSELSTIDRPALLQELEVPTLLVLDLDDESSINWPMAFIEATDWTQSLLDVPTSPLITAVFDDVRDPFFDRPLPLGRAIDDFLAGRDPAPLHPDLAQRGNQTSKPFRVSTAIGFTEIEIDYFAPSARGRQIWGGVVPWDRLWRAGANEATRIAINHDVVIEGHDLPAGTYSLLIHPRENEPWSVIFHEVPWLWSTAGYDPAYDALELRIDPEPLADPVEVLSYGVTERSTGQGELAVSWDDRRLSLDIKALEQLQFVEPVELSILDSLEGWTILSEDPAEDAQNPMIGLHDGVGLAVTYQCRTDLVWFRFELADAPEENTIGLNIAIDTDQNLDTGMSWWASNSSVTFDRLVTLWADGTDATGYAGTIGIASDDAVAASGNMTSLLEGGLELGIDRTRHRFYLGVPARELDDDGRMALIATVGTHIAWNDDLVDQGQVRLSLEEIRGSSCGE